MNENDDKNVLLYMLAGVGLGALIGAAAGLLFAPKAGTETRDDLTNKFKELKSKTEEWIGEQKAKKAKLEGALDSALEEVGA
jgi:gas vesicle protein